MQRGASELVGSGDGAGLRASMGTQFFRSLMWLALLLPAGTAVVAPVLLVPQAAVAQDEAAADAEPVDAGENLLVFYVKALGLRYVVVFLVLSFTLVALLVMCFLQLRRTALMPPELIEAFGKHAEAKEFQQAYDLAKADDSYLGHMLAEGMGNMQSGYASGLAAMQEAEDAEAMKLEHRISYVSLIGALAPMFGLLGTVDGMVAAFMVIARSNTQPRPSDLAVGISQALITTLIGLWLAIPAIACFALFKNWFARLTVEIHEEALRLMAVVQEASRK